MPSLTDLAVVIAAAAAIATADAAPTTAGAFPLQLSGTIVYVEDGDTLTLLDQHRRQHVIRLTDLDAPERAKKRYAKPGQPFSAASTRSLSGLAKGRASTAYCYEFDANQRLVCRVHVDNIDVSLEQIRRGFAWANRASPRYVRDDRAYAYEQAAQQSQLGLWSNPNPIPPWIWRRRCWNDGHCPGAGE